MDNCCSKLFDAVSQRHNECMRRIWDTVVKDPERGKIEAIEAVGKAALANDKYGMVWLMRLGVPLDPLACEKLGHDGHLDIIEEAWSEIIHNNFEQTGFAIAAARGAGMCSPVSDFWYFCSVQRSFLYVHPCCILVFNMPAGREPACRMSLSDISQGASVQFRTQYLIS